VSLSPYSPAFVGLFYYDLAPILCVIWVTSHRY